MITFSISHQLIKNTKDFLSINYYSSLHRLLGKKGVFYGWGRKKSGLKAIELAKKHGTSFMLLEDGFIRSVGLGVERSPSFSIVEDDRGIYYDATAPSRLEELLNSYDFDADTALMDEAKKAIALIKQHNISKYNSAPDADEGFCIKYGLTGEKFGTSERFLCPPGVTGEVDSRLRGNDGGMTGEVDSRLRGNDGGVTGRVLVIAQTAGDASLRYGLAERFTTDGMIDAAIAENPDAEVYVKVHPDVLSGRKKSDIDVEAAKKRCIIIEENVNPVSLLEQFDKVYTKTSGMGFEALLCGCECVCFGMPFYAGWGITDDRAGGDSRLRGNDGVVDPRVEPEDDGVARNDGEANVFQRRTRKRTVEEVFAAAYILYSRYYNPYTDKASDIFGTIEEIVKRKSVVQS